ncbi:hypothetical protein SAMN06273572_10324 [Monaibacterium marinum]|uniref:Uncharacterized protein n=2 Tax=Pontivivens marinum TaxID=1690039 RepID=A0A2C9CUC9_9RHOB|nr:hypothetical protein SAMN06273572_10324 [Monaibacterium marinum]
MRVRDDVAGRWTRQARKLGRVARQLEMDGSIRSGIAQHRPELLPEDAEILHRPSILRVLQTPSGQVSPATGTELSADVSVHHDMSPPRIVAHQMPRSQGRHEYALDIWNVRGNFVSLALALPPEQVSRIGKDDLIRVDYTIALEQQCDVFARLNLAHGPNVEQVIRQLDLRKQNDVLEFDVHYTAFDPTRAKEIWIDLIFNTRPLNRVVIRDIVISRRPRLSL